MDELHQVDPDNRRPLTSRSLKPAQAVSGWLVRRKVAPNTISVWSTLFALVGAGALFEAGHHVGILGRLFWLAAALCVQLRLLANMFDGMVAVESGVSSRLGELYNEIPDRISDAVTLIALGVTVGSSLRLGFLAAVLAVFVAYVRAMGGVAGAGQVFAGVMAKPQRMFLVTMLCLFQAMAPEAWTAPWLPYGLAAPGLVLALISVGCVITSYHRLVIISRKLRES